MSQKKIDIVEGTNNSDTHRKGACRKELVLAQSIKNHSNRANTYVHSTHIKEELSASQKLDLGKFVQEVQYLISRKHAKFQNCQREDKLIVYFIPANMLVNPEHEQKCIF